MKTTIAALGVAAEQRLAGTGLAWRTGPVNVRLRTSLPDVARSTLELYTNHPVLDEDAFIDFDVCIKRSRALWRPKVNFELDGQRPFNPLAGDQGFPLPLKTTPIAKAFAAFKSKNCILSPKRSERSTRLRPHTHSPHYWRKLYAYIANGLGDQTLSACLLFH